MGRTRRARTAFVLTVGLFLAGCGSVQRRAAEPPEVLAKFEFDPNAPWIFLPVTFAGEQYRFILDTGSTHTMWDASLKDRLGKRFLWPQKGTAAGGKSFAYEYFHAPEAFLGPLRVGRDGLIAVADLSGIGTGLQKKVDGILGMDFLGRYIVQIDFEQASVTFLKSHKGIAQADWGAPVRIKQKFLSSLPYIDGQVDGVQATFLADTGWGRRPGLGELASGVFKKARSRTLGGMLQALVTNMAETNTLRTGAFALSDRFCVAGLGYEDTVFYEGHESTLGMRLFLGHVVTFDFPARKLYLKRVGDTDVSSPVVLRLKGLGLGLRRLGGVVSVCAAEDDGIGYRKGVRLNDTLLAVDGKDVCTYSLAALVRVLSELHEGPDGIVIFTFKRGEAEVDISVDKSDLAREDNGTD